MKTCRVAFVNALFAVTQALLFAIDSLEAATKGGEGPAGWGAIKAEASLLFMLMKMHATLEDGVYFPAVAKQTHEPHLTVHFSGEHAAAAGARPRLLALLEKGGDGPEAYGEACTALQAYCSYNRKHQSGEEEKVNPVRDEYFTKAGAMDVVRAMAAFDAPNWNHTVVESVFARVNDDGRVAFLTSLKEAVPEQQYAEIAATVKGLLAEPELLLVPLEDASRFDSLV